MGATYDSGLFDQDDLAKAYRDGYAAAVRKLALVVRLYCPECAETFAINTYALPAVVIARERWCPHCETRVRPIIQLGGVE
jgi:hypothetical protein